MELSNKTSARASCQPVVVESISDEPETFKLTWTIKNYSGLANRQVVRKSDSFQAGSKSNHKWQIRVSPKRNFEGTEYFAYNLDLMDYGTKPASGKVLTKVFAWFVNANGQLTVPRGLRTKLVWKGMPIAWYRGTLTRSTTDPQFNLLKNDALTIQVQVELLPYEVGLVTTPTPTMMHQKVLETVKILRKSVPGDVTVKAANKEFKAHRELLKVVCPAMLRGNESRKTRQSLIVDASAFEDDVVEGLLNYFYEGETGLLKTPGKAIRLLQITKKYELEELKRRCETVVKENFKPTVDTVLDDLLVAHSAGIEDMKNICLDFFFKNRKAVQHAKSYRKHMDSAHIQTIFELYADYVEAKTSSQSQTTML